VTDSIKIKLLYGSAALFTILNLVFIVQGFYWLLALPMALMIVLLFFFSLDRLLLMLVFITPFSFTYVHEALGFAVDVPNEPVVVAIMALFFFRLIYERKYDLRLIRHPVSIILILQLSWMLVTTVSSEIPLVSVKYFLSRLWFVVTFYFVALQLFKNQKQMHRYMWLFGAALFLVVLRVLYIHYIHGFERELGYWVVRPFFNDHTHYGAVLALVLPFFAVMGFNRSYSPAKRRLALLFVLFFLAGVLFSYSRASWLSLMLGFTGFIILVFRIRLRLIVAAMILLVGSVYLFQHDIIMHLERNTQESSGDFSEHLRSVSNITSDASNLERINRWRSAVRMYQERPLLGWGPGTYQMVYAPFQRAEDYTIITTHFGDLGNAHSEYIGPLSESGMPGMLLVGLLALSVLITGIRLWKKAADRQMRLMALGISLGFITYFTHGFLNNFLDTDKVAVPFWGMMAMLVAMDIYGAGKKEDTEKETR
jgi:putative inorganic carbon (hco3(-)) transporter